MRMLLLTAEPFPTHRADLVVLFGKYLPLHGIHSDIVAGRTPGHIGAVAWGGGEAFLCGISGGEAKKHIKTLLHGVKHLFATDRNRYQALQVRDMPVMAVFGLLAARLKGLPFYYWMSYPMSEGQIELARERGLKAGVLKYLFPWLRGRVGRLLLYRLVLPRADHVFVQSERMLQDLADLGLAPAGMTPVPMGVDIDEIDGEAIVPANDPRLVGRRLIGYLGTQDRPRRLETLFQMLTLVKKTVPDVLLVLVGDTKDEVHRKWLRQQASLAGVSEHVLWAGWLPIKEGWRYIKACEVGLSPFPRSFLLDSASPTKVPEYLALGVPVVCNDNPDQEQIVASCGAGLCVPYTPERFAEAVISMLNLDADARRSMSEAGKRYIAEHRDYRILSEKLAAVYNSLNTLSERSPNV
jgi:glycosyltransferase involved in cell wall biosynthesis